MSAAEGWVIRSVGGVHHTTDGGETWTPQYFEGTTGGSHAGQFVNSDIGWVIGFDIFYTVDGGESWTKSSSHLADNEFECIFMIDENTGWVLGDLTINEAILHTIDGGYTWTPQTCDATNLSEIFFLDENTGWAVGSASWSNMIIHTSDGGETWNEQYSETGMYLNAVHMNDATNGWAVGQNGAIIHTIDGINWEMQTYQIDWDLESVYSFDHNNAWTVGRTFTEGFVKHTTDGGENWNFIDVGSTEHFYCIDFYDENTGWIIGTGGCILKTTDGGDNWDQIDAGITNDFRNMDIVGENEIYVVGNSGIILHTIDGGTTWETQSSHTDNHLIDVFFTDSNTGWIVGEGSLILHTTTGGGTEIEDFTIDVSQPQISVYNYPNPFRSETTLSFNLTTEHTENTEISIYNMKGQRVKKYSIFNPSKTGQDIQSSILWDGTDENNKPVASGFYLYNLKTGNETLTRKMMLIR